jgi:hypothetical protein
MNILILKAMKKVLHQTLFILVFSLLSNTSYSQMTQTFTYTGTDQSWTAPAGVTSISFVIWGAGGGMGGYSTSFSGGSGGFASGTLAVTPGTAYKIVVGQGGIGVGVGNSTNGGAATYGGGGFGTKGDASGASGGGLSGIFSGAAAMTFDASGQSRAMVIAGGGGGSCAYSGGGGAGGGTSGGGTTGGPGGTQSAGGTSTNGASGSALKGGNGDSHGSINSGFDDGGGGGGGYWGGGGGFSDATPGGGGSGFLGASVSGGTLTAGSNGAPSNAVSPPETSNSNYISGAGVGAYGNTSNTSGSNGGNGLVVITYNSVNAAVTFSDGSGYSPVIAPGSSNQPFGRFSLVADVSGSSLTAATLKLNGTRTGCTNFKLWESTSPTFSTVSATQKGSTVTSDPGIGNTVTFSSFSSNLGTGTKYYFLTCDIAITATGSIQGVVVNNSSFTFNAAALSGTITNAVLSSGNILLAVNHILGLGQQTLFTYTGSMQTWTVPAGTTTIQVISIGGGGSGGAAYWAGGGGGGGALAFKTALAVTPGNTCTVYAGRGGVGITANAGGQGSSGGNSYLTYSGTTVGAGGGTAGVGTNSNTNTPYAGGSGGSPYATFDGGRSGGTGGTSSGDVAGGGAGAAGYTGNGGNGGWTAGSGGGGAGGANGGNNGSSGAAQSGGGTGISGPGTAGSIAGNGGSAGSNGSPNATIGGSSYTGGLYGGGGGGQSNDSKSTPGCNGGNGAVAIYHGYVATYGDPPLTLNSKATSGLTITYSTSDAAVATISGNILTITGAGSCTIYADQAGNSTYPAAQQVSQSLTVASSFPGVTTAAVSSVAATTATCGGTVTSEGGYSVTVRGVCWNTSVGPTTSNYKTTNGSGVGSFVSSITGLTPGTPYYVRAYATNSYGTSYGQQYSFTPFQLGSFPDITKTYGDAPFTLVNPTSISPGAFSYESSNLSVATIAGNTVTIIGAGTSTITVTQAASGVFGSASATALLTVAKADQVITLSIPTSAPLNTFIGTSVTINATSSSTLGVTVTKGGTATATLNGSVGNYTLTNVGSAGTVIFYADQAGNPNYNPASASQSFDVQMGNQTINFAALSSKTFGDPPFSLTATGGGSGNPVMFTSSYPLVATCTGANGETLTILAAGTVIISASQAGNENWNPAGTVIQQLTINKATPVIANFADVGKTFGDESFTLNASSASTGAYTYTSQSTNVATISGNTVTITGAGSTLLSATQAADANYTSAIANATLTVSKADQSITITGIPADISLLSFENNPIQAAATSTSGLAVSLSLELGSVATIDGSNIITSSGSIGSVVVHADQAGNTNFNSTTAGTTFTVSKLPQTITFGALPVKNIGDPPFDLAASSSSSLDVVFSSGTTSVATISGKSVTIVGATGTSLITATQTGNAYYDAATPVEQTLTVQACTGAVNPTGGGTIGLDQNSCTSFDPALITSSALPSGHTGTLEYKWQSTVSPFSVWVDIAGTNADAFDPGTVLETTRFRRLARVTCISDWALAASSNAVVMTVNGATPATPGTITGMASQCPGLTGETYSIVPIAFASTYSWTLPEGWTIIDGAGTTSVSVYTGAAGQNGNITVAAGNCGSYSAVSTLTVTVNPPEPFNPPTIADLLPAGTEIRWYHDATGGSPLANSVVLENGHRYYASQIVNSCESTARLEVTANVDATPCKPGGNQAQTYGTGATVASLQASGDRIRWYDAATSGNLLPSGTLLENGHHYFASQTVNCIESATRFAVTVTVTP